MSINPGNLRHRIKVLEANRIITPGGTSTLWDEVDARWAAVTPVSASGAAKYSTAGVSEVTHEVMLRAGLSVTLGGTLFKHNSMILQPQAPPIVLGERITIPCLELREGAPGGETSSVEHYD